MRADADRLLERHDEGDAVIRLQLPPSARADDLAELARDRNVFFAPGTGFFVNPDDGAHHLRMSFSFVPPNDLRAGIETLGRLIGEMIR